MQTDRFNQLRKDKLSKIFESKKIIEVWRKIVRDQLRSLDLKDLFDHYDFNFNIEIRAEAIRSEILGGTYKVSQPLIYRIEKKFGICRHLVIPQPIDALVLQVLVEFVSTEILKNQPSPNAFYSRDKHNVSSPHSVEEYGFTWRQQWKQLQKKIYNFQQDKDFIVVTDLTNYYDSIDINELRKVFTSYSQIDEVLIDLLFRIIEEISWKPDYLPYSKRGLPTTNIEGIRLLAHSFLFEVDEVLANKSDNSFTRWMDDIVIGMKTKKHAVETLSSISDILKSRGLALNLSKTNIYDEKEGYYHFQIEANRYIDLIEKIKKTDDNYKSVCSQLHSNFKQHLKDRKPKYWDKISKRYITTYGKLKCKTLLNIIVQTYIENPGLRANLIYYLLTLGYSNRNAGIVLSIVDKIDIFDDISLYQICFLVTQWEIKISEENDKFLKNFENKITKFSVQRKNSSDFYCSMWFKAKYSHPEELLGYIRKYQYIWNNDTFLRRQVTSILSRLLFNNNNDVIRLLNSQISSGVPNTVTLANQIYYFRNLKQLDSKMNFYLFPQSKQKIYPLAKFLVLCSVLNSEHIRNDHSIREKVREYITDPYFKKWIELQYNIK
ncbi:RNA-directed DNA polymerase [Sphingobacterium sp. UBA6320]|uniref:RNA-directed DNA polymerase n=1 Tax=Sphingobacterium sp. UBA6320 TaxID=1947510 RepID=UPI0025F4D340|nr:RNA-directed DNA polymerase [Sphingobacterium sp. UBA6320]